MAKLVITTLGIMFLLNRVRIPFVNDFVFNLGNTKVEADPPLDHPNDPIHPVSNPYGGYGSPFPSQDI